MMTFYRIVESLRDEKGQTLIEYLFLVAFIAMVIYGTLLVFGPGLSNAYQNVINNL